MLPSLNIVNFNDANIALIISALFLIELSMHLQGYMRCGM